MQNEPNFNRFGLETGVDWKNEPKRTQFLVSSQADRMGPGTIGPCIYGDLRGHG